MKVKTALILCAGYGKRLNPLTFKTPKPLLKFRNLTMLDHTINFIENLGLKKIKLNTFYLEKQIIDFVSSHPLKKKIEVISDGKKILGTGGGILNLMNHSDENDFLIFNPDTFWNSNYLDIINQMCEIYFEQKMENCLLLAHKNKSYDLRLNGDFGMNGNILYKEKKNFIFTGCQIINKKLFNGYSKNFFSISEIWDKKLNQNDLYGEYSEEEFIHLTDLEIYNKLLKID
jgi:N-acetyl-alpha-D-muramate 1-phosphate uridylyltransferase